ncbi:MAG: hypothetical protein QX196_01540 [Methylococcaceae bacterium]
MKTLAMSILLGALLAMQAAYSDGHSSRYFSSFTDTDIAQFAPSNLITNGSFEKKSSQTGLPSGWITDYFASTSTFTWDSSEAHTGSKSAKILSPTPNDSRWITTAPVQIQPNMLYNLSGWIKTDNIADTDQSENVGANLSVFGTWTHTKGLTGTHDWIYRSLLFNSGSDTQLTIGARLGYWSGTTTGTAWFDDLRLVPITPMNPHPSWKILVLIYGTTDFTYTDSMGTQQHFIATMTEDEKEQAANNATKFVKQDVPELTSGNMKPNLTIRYPDHALTQLTNFGGGWSPAPEDTEADRDPAFDSVIVIWDPRAIEQNTGQPMWIGAAAGLTHFMGTEQTYLAMIIESAVYYGNLNVFKHEFGHSILFYFEAAGVASKPSVSNHADAGQYVHCPTGEQYVWQDETDENLIPNSIYNNNSGFTHDYYSGITATADQPTRCLGITPEAWSYGGAVSNSANIISNLTITSLTAHPNVLWPPNGKMVPVKITASTEDLYNSNPICRIISVTSNEASGKKPDWMISGDLTINLRAERSGKGGGRVYTTEVGCEDTAGNRVTKVVTVTVPHSQGKHGYEKNREKQIHRRYVVD